MGHHSQEEVKREDFRTPIPHGFDCSVVLKFNGSILGRFIVFDASQGGLSLMASVEQKNHLDKLDDSSKVEGLLEIDGSGTFIFRAYIKYVKGSEKLIGLQFTDGSSNRRQALFSLMNRIYRDFHKKINH
jgi:hypothetical protein